VQIYITFLDLQVKKKNYKILQLQGAAANVNEVGF
jgi:hypothetical protein